MNSTSLTLSANEHQSLQALLAALPDPRAQVSAPDCSTYQTYRPILQTALPFIQRIPVYGSKIATALSFLMQLADGVCNIPAPLVTPGDATGKQSAGTIKIEKSGDNELRVILPQGAKINADNISEADLYFALSRDLVKASGSAGSVGGCVGDNPVICPIKW